MDNTTKNLALLAEIIKFWPKSKIFILQSKPGNFMDCCCETVEMAVPPTNRRGVGPEAYLNSTSQWEPVLSEVEGTPEDARKDCHIRGRSRPFMKLPG
jgi:hypothetical protein